MASLVTIIFRTTHDRAEYAQALQPVLAACEARLAHFAASDAPAFAVAVQNLVDLAGSFAQSDGGSCEARAHLQQLADRDAAPAAARLLYVLAAVCACSHACDSTSAERLRTSLEAGMLQAGLDPMSRDALCSALARACSDGGKQCACQHAVLTGALVSAMTTAAAAPAVSEKNHFEPLEGVTVPAETGELQQRDANAFVALLSPCSQCYKAAGVVVSTEARYTYGGREGSSPLLGLPDGVRVQPMSGCAHHEIGLPHCAAEASAPQVACAACVPAKGDCWPLVRRLASSPYDCWESLTGNLGRTARVARKCNPSATLSTSELQSHCWVMLVVAR